MKFIILILLLCMGASCQTTTCKSLHEGKFKVTTKKTGTTFITRENNLQFEENADLKLHMVFYIKWTSDCSYELRPKHLILGDSIIVDEGYTVTVLIKEVGNKKYKAVSTSDFDDNKLEYEVEVLK